MPEVRYVTTTVIKTHGICTYNEYVGPKSSRTNQTSWAKDVKQNSYTGYMTSSAVKKLRSVIDLWFNSCLSINGWGMFNSKKSSRTLNFLTLTLPSAQVHDDKFIKRRIFQPFMERLQRVDFCKPFIWRAEMQKNGNIHF